MEFIEFHEIHFSKSVFQKSSVDQQGDGAALIKKFVKVNVKTWRELKISLQCSVYYSTYVVV